MREGETQLEPSSRFLEGESRAAFRGCLSFHHDGLRAAPRRRIRKLAHIFEGKCPPSMEGMKTIAPDNACAPAPAHESASHFVAAARPYVKATADILAEVLWPTRCAVCDAPGAVLCDPCVAALPYIDWNRACPRCGAPFGIVQCCECNGIMLAAAQREQPPYDRLVSALSLTEAARRIAAAYKDGGERRLASEMARIVARCVPPDWAAEKPLVTFVPASTRAYRKRGFDHAQELSAEVARLMQLEHRGLFARPHSFDQRQLSRAQRLVNMAGRLEVEPGCAVPACVIVVDDVCTTSATLFAACDALREAGAKRIWCLTFARA